MKVKIRKTGEIVDVVRYNKGYCTGYPDFVIYIDSKGVERTESTLNYFQTFEPIEESYGDKEYEQGKKDVQWCINQAKKNAKNENEMGTCWFAEKWLDKQKSITKDKNILNCLKKEDNKKIKADIIYILANADLSKVTTSFFDMLSWLEKQK